MALSTKLIGALLIAALPVTVTAREIAVVGPIDWIDCGAKRIKVLGVSFAADGAATSQICKRGSYLPGSYVSAVGEVSVDGSIRLRKLATVAAGSYVPGASTVYIRGDVSDTNVKTGNVSMSGALIDVQSFPPAVGTLIEVVGTQPLPNGVVLPLVVNVIDAGASVVSSVGSGVEITSSVGSGSEIKSSVGSGAEIISSVGSGSQLKSSVGSGAQVIRRRLIWASLAMLALVCTAIATQGKSKAGHVLAAPILL